MAVSDWTGPAGTAVGAVIGLSGALLVARHSTASQRERAELARDEERLRRRSEAYEQFMFHAHRFHLNAIGVMGELTAAQEKNKWRLEFEQQYVAVRMYGTHEVAAAAQRLHDVIGQLLDVEAYDDAADERFVAAYHEAMAAIRADTAPDTSQPHKDRRVP